MTFHSLHWPSHYIRPPPPARANGKGTENNRINACCCSDKGGAYAHPERTHAVPPQRGGGGLPWDNFDGDKFGRGKLRFPQESRSLLLFSGGPCMVPVISW